MYMCCFLRVYTNTLQKKRRGQLSRRRMHPTDSPSTHRTSNLRPQNITRIPLQPCPISIPHNIFLSPFPPFPALPSVRTTLLALYHTAPLFAHIHTKMQREMYPTLQIPSNVTHTYFPILRDHMYRDKTRKYSIPLAPSRDPKRRKKPNKK